MASKRTQRKSVGSASRRQAQGKHSPEWRQDLNPDAMAGQNIGRKGTGDESAARTAADIKNLSQRLTQFLGDELAQIPIVPRGTRLKQGAVYIDLRDPAPVPFTATAELIADDWSYYAAKAEVPHEIWNRLVEALAPAPAAGERSDRARPFSPEAGAGHARAAAEADEEPASSAFLDETVAETFPASDAPAWTTGRERTPDDLSALSDEALDEKAREYGIEKHPNMTRAELVCAIRRRR
ncbi:MAG TPA: hypothetical protein VNO43_02305 [Candidatus Eisenbacteria bacterium]|nr:hypothetical protein [Candidatus Eisenbacteria bacterium]